MDEKLKTQTFRFTNQFKVEGYEDESMEVSQNIQMQAIESDEDSIQEEIETSQASVKDGRDKRGSIVNDIMDSTDILKKMTKPPLFPGQKSSSGVTSSVQFNPEQSAHEEQPLLKVETMTKFKDQNGHFKNSPAFGESTHNQIGESTLLRHYSTNPERKKRKPLLLRAKQQKISYESKCIQK